MNAQSGRLRRTHAQMLLELGAYACMFMLFALAGRLLLVDLSARAEREGASTTTTTAEPGPAATEPEVRWIKSGYHPPLRGGFGTD